MEANTAEANVSFSTEMRRAATPQQSPRITVVIPARNEATIIGGTLRALSMHMARGDQLHVVADHCRDDTAEVAIGAGAIVHTRRNGGSAGKGQALKWWLEKTHQQASPDDWIVVLDADSQVAPNFFESLRGRLQDGEVAIQTRVEPLLRSLSPISRLAAFSETVEQMVNDSLRARLGWPVRLRGTGMAFRRDVLAAICRSLETLVEDVEMTLQLGAQGTPISFAAETFVADPKPNDQDGAVRQRARWMKGQWQVARTYLPQIFKLLARGPGGWSLLSSVLLKPKTLLVPIKAFLALFFFSLAAAWGGFSWALAGAVTFSLFSDIAVLLYGLRFAQDRKQALQILALSPIYMMMWLRSLALSAISGDVWHRARRLDPAYLPALGDESGLWDKLAWLERKLNLQPLARSVPSKVRTVWAESGD